jgi:hypothetical protein
VLKTVNQIWGNSNKHIWVYLLNEPHANGVQEITALNNLLAQSIELLCSNGYKVVAGNFSAGTIDNPDLMEDFLYTASKWKNQVLLSEHMYAMVQPNNFGWGYRRSNPEIEDSQNFIALNVEQSLDYLHPKYWLTRKNVQMIFDTPFETLPSWHYGRIKTFYHYAKHVLGIELPPYIATECLLDDLPDLEIVNGQERKFEWNGSSKVLKKHIFDTYGSSYSQIKGDLSYDKMYESVYGLPFYQCLFMILSAVDRTFPKECIGLNLFTYSNAPDWTRYGHNYALIFEQLSKLLIANAQKRDYTWIGGQDYSDADEIYKLFDNVYIEKDENTMPDFPIVDWSDNSFKKFEVLSESNWNVRTQPSIIYDAIGAVKPDDIILISETDKYVYTDTRYRWEAVILSDGTKGWVVTNFMDFTSVDETIPDGDYVTRDEFEALKTRVTELEDQQVAYGSALQNLQNQINNLNTVDGIVLPDEHISILVSEFKKIHAAQGNIFAVLQEFETE